MDTSELFDHLHKLEVSLHSTKVRSDRNELGKILHNDFVEFGRSGKIYSRTQVLEEFQEPNREFQIITRDYTYKLLAENIVLITYESAHIVSNGSETRRSLRSSIWQKSEQGWQLIFHQGTPQD
jgi:hypothetical protein